MPRSKVELRLHELGLPDEIVTISQTHRDLPPRARARVELAITEYEDEISSIRMRIADLELPKEWYTRQDLYQEEADVKRKLQACRSLLSIMRRIPFETMGEIFEYYLTSGGKGDSIPRENDDQDSDEDENSEDDGPERTPSPGLLCLVCKHWKVVATTTPSLWSNIHVRAQEQKVGEYPHVKSAYVRGILSWMDRVTSHPWSLTVQATRHRNAAARDESSVPLSQLLNRPASLHLRRLQIEANQFSVGLGEMTFPRVTSVVINCDHGDERADPPLPDLPSMPALKKAVFCCILKTAYIPIHIPWSQLTHLVLARMVEIPQWRAIFKLCTALQQGCFHLVDADAESDIVYPEPAEVTLPDLTDLTFLYMSPFMEPLHGVSVPSLTKLQLLTGWATPAWDTLHPDLFQNLTHLSLINSSWAEADHLISILQTVPRLTELFFPLAIGLEEVFNFLTFGHEGKFNLRCLRALGIHVDMERVREPVDDNEGAGGGGDNIDPEDERLPFPFQALTSFISSRTQAVQRGDFTNRPHSLTPLQQLVLRVDMYNEWAYKMVLKLREEVAPFDKYGLKTLVFKDDASWGTDFGSWIVQHRHWDEGFIDVIRGEERYSLYPREPEDLVSDSDSK